jgi:hypothetical protein
MGHSYSRIARALGCHFETVQRLARGDVSTVPAALRGDVTRLYEQWWDKRPPERTKGERMAAEASRQRAARAGWCTGAGLDDARIDDPSYVPQASWRRAVGTGIAPDDPLGRERAHAPAQEGTPMAFDPPQEATERQKGAALAHTLIVRGAEAGRSADLLAGKHEELLGQMVPDAEQTPAEREWLAGFRDEAEGTLATLRDLERASAAEREAEAG